MNLAPIGISTYSRVNHLKRTIQSLRANPLASESVLYIFSDAAKPGDEEKVNSVREYIHSITGFKKLHLVERKTNGRTFNNRAGMKQLLDEHEKIIFLEEDIATSRGFLQFMNQALDYYKDDGRILSISGYCPPIKLPESYVSDAFLLQRFCAWGFATWKEKFDPFGFELDDHGIESFLKDKKAIRAFRKNGEDMLPMLLDDYHGRRDALDVKLMYYEFKYGLYTLYPAKSLTQNIGYDGSGIHCGDSRKFDIQLWDKTMFHFAKDIGLVDEIVDANREFRSLSLTNKIKRKLDGYPGLYRALQRAYRTLSR